MPRTTKKAVPAKKAAPVKKASPAKAAPAKRSSAKKAAPAKATNVSKTNVLGQTVKGRTPAKKSRAEKNAERAASKPVSRPAAPYVADPKGHLQRIVDLTGLSGIDVQMHDETAGVIVVQSGRLTYTFIPNTTASTWELEVTSADDSQVPDQVQPVMFTQPTPENVAAWILKAFMGEAAPKKITAPSEPKPRRSANKATTPVGSITQKQYDDQIKAIDNSDLGSRFKAAAKAVLTKKARESGLTVAGSRKPTDGMTSTEVAQRRSDAAKRAVETRRANEAAKAAEAAKAERASKRAAKKATPAKAASRRKTA